MKEAKKVYVGVCFDNLTLDPGEVKGEDLNKLATSRELIGREANKFLKAYFKPGDLVEVQEGVCMIDKMFNLMKPNYHIDNPERAKQLAGI